MVMWVTLVLYLLMMIVIGVYCRKRTNNVSDFVLAGRNVGAWMTAFAYGTSYFSAVIFIGYAGQFGWSYGVAATWIGIGNAIIGSLLAWVILGDRTRRMTKQLNVSTMPEFFEKRYMSKSLKIAAALIVFLFLIPYTASVYNGLSTLFASAFSGIDYNVWIIIMALLTAIYVILGGYMATAVNDFIQGVIMLFGIIAVIVCALTNQGGLTASLENLSLIPTAGGETGAYGSLLGPDPINLFAVIILTSLGTWGLPQMVQKFYAIKDKKAIKRGTIISTLFAVVVAGGSYFLGGLGRLFATVTNEAGKTQIATLSNQSPDFDSIVPAILQRAVPDILFGIVVVLVLSASMSTLASLVLTSSSTLTIDMIKPFSKKDFTEKKQVLIMRIFIAVFLIISVIIAIFKNDLNAMGINISALMSISWGTLAGSFLAPFMYGLFSKRITRASVWLSFFTGVCITVVSMVLFNLGLFPALTDWAKSLPLNLASPISWGAIAMIVGLIEVPLASLVTKNKNQKEIDALFDEFKQTV